MNESNKYSGEREKKKYIDKFSTFLRYKFEELKQRKFIIRKKEEKKYEKTFSFFLYWNECYFPC